MEEDEDIDLVEPSELHEVNSIYSININSVVTPCGTLDTEGRDLLTEKVVSSFL